MSSKYVCFILFYILTTSCITNVSSLFFEAVDSDDELRNRKPQEDKGKGQETTQEPLETTADTALRDTLENVCKNLRMRDLIHVGLVCKAWNRASKREISKRGLERALLPHIYRDISDVIPNFLLSDILHTKPYVGILFLGPLTSNILHSDLESRTVVEYRRYFPQHLVTIGVDECMMDEQVIVSRPPDMHSIYGSPNGILGLFIPQHEDLRVKVSSFLLVSQINISQIATKIMNDMSIDSNQRSTIILLGSSVIGSIALEQVLDLIKTRLVQQRYSLWGGCFNGMLIHSRTRDSRNDKMSGLFALHLSGSNIRSWSTFLNCKIKKHEFDQRLIMFKNNLNLAHHSIGLVCGPEFVDITHEMLPEDMYLNNIELMAAVKRVFPNIPFIGIFDMGLFPTQIGVDSMSEDNNQQLSDRMSLSLMIITHD